MAKGTRYTGEFKSKAVRLLTESRTSYSSEMKAIEQVAKDLGIAPESLRRWRNQSYATVAAETKQSTQYAMAELGKLQDPGGPAKLVRKYSAYTLLAIDEWLVDKPNERFRRFLLELMELRYDNASTAFATQLATKEWHSRLGGDTIADAILDRIVHNTV